MPTWEAMWTVHAHQEHLHPRFPGLESVVLVLTPRLPWIELLSARQAKQCACALTAMITTAMPVGLLANPNHPNFDHAVLRIDWLRAEGARHTDVYDLYLAAWIESLLDALQARQKTDLRREKLVAFWMALSHLCAAMNDRQHQLPDKSPDLRATHRAVAHLIQEFEYKGDPDLC